MDLNKTYQLNIISQKIKGSGLLLVVERFNDHSSHHFQNYYQKLRRFNQCSEWFQKLEYPTIEKGAIVLTKTNKKTNSWSRGIISTLNTNNNSQSQLYFIDTQRIVSFDSCLEFRFCPPKFSNLVLPTYNIDVDFGLNNDDLLQSAVEMLIEKNQCGDISFSFTPQSFTKDNIYLGELIINYEIDNSVITLDKFIKNVLKKKKLNGPEQKLWRYSIFDPLSQFIDYPNIFIPKDFSKKIFSDQNQTTSFSELIYLNDSLESDESSSMNNSEYYSFSDETANKIEITQNNCDSTEKQKLHSSLISSENNFSTYSTDNSPSECIATVYSNLTESINVSTEQNQDTSLDFNCKLSPIISTATKINSDVTPDNNDTNNPMLRIKLESKPNSVNNQENKINTSNYDASLSSSENNSNLSINSIKKSPSKCTATIIDSTTESIYLSTEQNQDTSLDFNDCKLSPIISTPTKINSDVTPDNNDTNIPMPRIKLESKPNSVNNQENKINSSNYEASLSSSGDNSNLSIISIKKSPSKCTATIIDTTTESIYLSTEQNQNASLDCDNVSELNPVILTPTAVNVDFILSVDNDTNNLMPKTDLESKSNSNNNQEIKVDTSNNETDIRRMMKNYFCCLKKLQDTRCEKENDLHISTQQIMELPTKPSENVILLYGDGLNVCWSDSDEDSNKSNGETK